MQYLFFGNRNFKQKCEIIKIYLPKKGPGAGGEEGNGTPRLVAMVWLVAMKIIYFERRLNVCLCVLGSFQVYDANLVNKTVSMRLNFNCFLLRFKKNKMEAHLYPLSILFKLFRSPFKLL